MITTDFNEWLDIVDIENYEEVDDLYQAIDQLSSCGSFEIKPARGENNGWIVYSTYGEDQLHIKTEEARKAFLKLIESRYCDGEIESVWYSIMRANEKDD